MKRSYKLIFILIWAMCTLANADYQRERRGRAASYKSDSGLVPVGSMPTRMKWLEGHGLKRQTISNVSGLAIVTFNGRDKDAKITKATVKKFNHAWPKLVKLAIAANEAGIRV